MMLAVVSAIFISIVNGQCEYISVKASNLDRTDSLAIVAAGVVNPIDLQRTHNFQQLEIQGEVANNLFENFTMHTGNGE